MRVLITGASGFLGRNLLLAVDRHWEIVTLQRSRIDLARWASERGDGRLVETHRCDLRDERVTAEVLGRVGPVDVAYHFAARVDIPGSLSDPTVDLLDNGLATLNLVRHIKCKHFVHLSSGAVYEGHSGPVAPALPLSPSLPYAIHKLLSEGYARAAHRRYETAERVTIIRFFGAYGPYEPPHKVYRRLVRAFAIEREPSISIYGDGSNLIDAMWVGDACMGLLAVARSSPSTEPVEVFDFAAGDAMSVETLVRRAANAFGVENVEIQRSGHAPERNDFHAQTEPFQSRFGCCSELSLEDGLRLYADYMRLSDTAE